LSFDRGYLKSFLSGTAVACLACLLAMAAFVLPAGTAAGEAGPDLTVTEISLSPNNPAIGVMVTVTATVKNQGTSSCGASSLAGYVDGALLTTFPVGALEAGQVATVTFTWQATAGTHSIKATADSAGTIAETDETNNSRIFTLTTLAPDLTVQSVTWTPSAPSKGDSVAISVVVKNQGSLRSTETRLNLYIDGTTRGDQNLLAIDPGSTATLTYSWIAQTGQHTFRAVVDEDNHVIEGDETNNERTVTFTTLAPDLVIPDITWSPQNPSTDDDVTFDITIKNQGSGRADASLLSYYIDDVYQSLLNVGTLEAGASVNISFTWKALPDEHSIKAIADFPGNLTEGDETNNEKTITFSTLAPDLTVKDITWQPQVAAVGDTITFTATIKNQGSGNAIASRAIAYIDGGFAGYLNYPPINAGKEASMTLKWQATPGSHVISIVADDDQRLKESNEDNNKMNREVPLIPPDLVISAVSWSPETPSVGDTVTFTVTVANQGGGQATSFYVAYYVDDEVLMPVSVAGIACGASVNTTGVWTAEAGRHTFRAVADAYSRVPEGDENNNEYTVVFGTNMPDLAVGTVTWTPADLAEGKEITFNVEIENVGGLSAGPSRLAYYVDGEAAGYIDIGRLDSGDSVTEAFPWVAAGGVHSIKIVADASGQVMEADEANNIKVVGLPPPDLVVGDIAWSPASASAGEKVTFTAPITNRGSGRSGDTTVSCYIDGELLASNDLPGIDPGAASIASFDWQAEAGVHTIKIIADPADRVTESDETNNDQQAGFATLTPDLCFGEVGWLVGDPLLGNEVSFSVVVRNGGTGAAPASRLEYAIDGGPANYEDVGALAAGTSATITFKAGLEAGPHSLTFKVDADGKVDELDETNNTRALSLSTIVPDLVVKSISWEPPDATVGDAVTITVKVENRGRDKAVGPLVTLSIDGSALGSADIPELEVGGVAALDFKWMALSGQHEITALADAENTVTESDETNNSRSRTIEIEGAASPATSLAGPATGATSKGFLGDSWWIVLLGAAILGTTAFVLAMRSFKKDQ
jgi:subtilase family serine protease